MTLVGKCVHKKLFLWPIPFILDQRITIFCNKSHLKLGVVSLGKYVPPSQGYVCFPRMSHWLWAQCIYRDQDYLFLLKCECGLFSTCYLKKQWKFFGRCTDNDKKILYVRIGLSGSRHCGKDLCSPLVYLGTSETGEVRLEREESNRCLSESLWAMGLDTPGELGWGVLQTMPQNYLKNSIYPPTYLLVKGYLSSRSPEPPTSANQALVAKIHNLPAEWQVVQLEDSARPASEMKHE